MPPGATLDTLIFSPGPPLSPSPCLSQDAESLGYCPTIILTHLKKFLQETHASLPITLPCPCLDLSHPDPTARRNWRHFLWVSMWGGHIYWEQDWSLIYIWLSCIFNNNSKESILAIIIMYRNVINNEAWPSYSCTRSPKSYKYHQKHSAHWLPMPGVHLSH